MKKKGFNSSVINQILSFGLRYKKELFTSIFCSFLLGFVSAYRPYLFKIAIDENIIPKDYEGLVRTIGYIIILIVLEVLFQTGLLYTINLVAQLVIKDIRIALFQKIQHFKLSYFDKTPIGTLVTRSVSDIETIATIFNNGIQVIFSDTLKIIYVIILMLVLDWQVALLIIAITPLVYWATRLFQKAIRKGFQAEREEVSNLNSFVQERLSGITILKSFGREEEQQEQFKQINTRLLKAHLKNVFNFSLFFPVVDLISALAIALLIWYAGWYSLGNFSVEPGEVAAFFFYIQMLFRPLRQIADRFNQMQRGFVGAERVFKILNNEGNTLKNGILKSKIEGRVEFKNAAFSYLPEEPILKNLSFAIQKGETVAVVGETGAGKSTIINLISRFYEINKGTILIDNKNIKEFDLETLRKQIVVVLQDVFLFSGTLRDNITLFNEEITDEEIWNVAEQLQLKTYFESLPNKLNYQIQERGASLSSGQRQLISFIRAYLADPKILILDEATASIDIESEKLIKEATAKLTKNRTAIIIAHRLNTIDNADKVLVLDKGKLIEFDTPKELLKNTEGKFYKFYNN